MTIRRDPYRFGPRQVLNQRDGRGGHVDTPGRTEMYLHVVV